MTEADNTEQKTANTTGELLYSTMANEANGFYSQMITISTLSMGGSVVFYDKFFTVKSAWSIWLLFFTWIFFIFPVAILTWIRWQNVEAHRHMLKYFKKNKEEEYRKVEDISIRTRKWTAIAIVSLVLALLTLAIFASVNIYYKPK